MNEMEKPFLFGASLSAHQVEGKNIHSDWWLFEQKILKKNGVESGEGTKHWHFYPQDFELAKQLGHNCHRLSLEWAKIEPLEGKIDFEIIEHYKKVFEKLKQNGLTPIVTLWHFTLPKWFANLGGFHKKENIKHYVNFCKFICTEFREELKYVITINEPEIYSYNSYLTGLWPPQKKSFSAFFKVMKNLLTAHIMCYKALKTLKPELIMGISKNNQVFRPARRYNPFDILLLKFFHNIWNIKPLKKIKKQLDFIGLNYYFYHCVKADLHLAKSFMQYSYPTTRHTDQNWEVYPKGLYLIIKELDRKFKLPVLITEHGVADKNDKLRADAINEALYWIFKAKNEKANVLGYIHWALTDNFEWTYGYEPKFGLIEINYKTFARTVRPSALKYKELIEKYNKVLLNQK